MKHIYIAPDLRYIIGDNMDTAINIFILRNTFGVLIGGKLYKYAYMMELSKTSFWKGACN